MEDGQRTEDSDNADIEGKSLWGSLRVPVRRADVGPYIKWVIAAISVSIVILAIGGAIALSK